MAETLPSTAPYASIGAQAFQYKTVWSATDSYYFFPNAYWDEPGSRIVFSQRNHNLETSDVVQFVVGNPALSPGWVQSNVSVTKIDAHTFSTVQLNDPGSFPAGISNPPGPQTLNNNGFMITCMNYSKLMFLPSVVQGDTLPAATTIVIEGKVHPDAEWITLATHVIGDGAWSLTVTPRYNFVRGRRSVGTGQPVVYAQY